MTKTAKFAVASVLGLSLAANALWVSMAGSVLQFVCESRLSLVRLDAAESEKSGRWLDAAHAYAYLIHYSGNSELGCRSPELRRNAWIAPIAAILLDRMRPGADSLRGADELDRAALQESYARALEQAGLQPSRGSTPDSVSYR